MGDEVFRQRDGALAPDADFVLVADRLAAEGVDAAAEDLADPRDDLGPRDSVRDERRGLFGRSDAHLSAELGVAVLDEAVAVQVSVTVSSYQHL